MIDFLNSREDAAVIWAVAILVFVVYKSDGEILGSLWDVVRAFFAHKLLILFGSAAVYCTAVVWIGERTGLWHRTALKETTYAVLGSFVLVGRAVQMRPGAPRYLRKMLGSALRVTIVIEFVVNMYVFPLVVELILFPVMVMLLVTQGADRHDSSKRTAARFASTAIAYLGVLALAYVAVSAATDLGGLLSWENAERLLVAPALAIALLPFLYAVSWWSQQEQRKLDERFSRHARSLDQTGPEEPLSSSERAA